MLANEFSTNIKRYLPQILSVVIKNAVLFSYGSSVGMSTILVDSLAGSKLNESIFLDQEGISWIASVNHLCVPIGSLFSGWLSSICGRKRALQFVSLPFCAGFLLLYFSSQSWQVFFGLTMTAISGGLSEAPALSYAAEVSEPVLRGSLTATSTLFISAGILFSFIFGTFFPWRTVALVNACVCIAALVLLMFVPETPYWLAGRGRLKEAQQSLAWLRGWTTADKVEKEFEEVVRNTEQNKLGQAKNLSSIKIYLETRCIKPFFLILLVFIIGHFGVSPITAYQIPIFNLFQVPISSYYATILTGGANLASTTLFIIILRFSGKRLLNFISLSGVSICFLIAGIYAYCTKLHLIDSPLDAPPSHSWIPLASLVLMGSFSYFMIYSLPWILMGEIYYHDIRDVASGASAAAGYLIGFAANKSFLNLVMALSLPGVFWFYSGVAFVGLILLYFLLPETEGKSLFDISKHYNGGKKLDNKVYKS